MLTIGPYRLRAATCSCGTTNLEVFSQFLADSFQQLVKIHPFANGNGRLATLVMNIFLVVSGYPSILLRLPSDKKNPASEYSKAFAVVDEDTKPLANLIKSQIEKALLDLKKESSSEEGKEILFVRAKMELCSVLNKILEYVPNYDL